MEFNIGITPEALWNWLLGLLYKLWLWLLSGRKWYLLILGVIVCLIILYKLLDNYLYNKYRGKYEKSI